jgi:hypothetical protein
MANISMNPKDAVFGSLAECYITMGDNRYNMMQLYDFESNYEINIADVPTLGRVTVGRKPAGGSGSWSGTAHYNTSVFRQYILNYVRTGRLDPFDMQITNEDPTSAAGRQTVILRGCLPDSVVIAKYAAGEDILDEDISGTFDDFEMPETFTPLTGML